MNATAAVPSTRDRILDIAQRLIQSRGYNAFSFNDLAKELKLRTASVHYHFPTKSDLGVALVRRYRGQLHHELDWIAKSGENPLGCLEQFIAMFDRTFRSSDALCLSCVLSAEAPSLPKPVAAEVTRFFHDAELSLAKIFTAGKRARVMTFRGSPRAQARMLMAMIQGAMLVARGLRHRSYFRDMTRGYLAKYAVS